MLLQSGPNYTYDATSIAKCLPNLATLIALCGLLYILLMPAGVTSMIASTVVSNDVSNGMGRCQHSVSATSNVVAAQKVFLIGSSHTPRREEAYMHSD